MIPGRKKGAAVQPIGQEEHNPLSPSSPHSPAPTFDIEAPEVAPMAKKYVEVPMSKKEKKAAKKETATKKKSDKKSYDVEFDGIVQFGDASESELTDRDSQAKPIAASVAFDIEAKTSKSKGKGGKKKGKRKNKPAPVTCKGLLDFENPLAMDNKRADDNAESEEFENPMATSAL